MHTSWLIWTVPPRPPFLSPFDKSVPIISGQCTGASTADLKNRSNYFQFQRSMSRQNSRRGDETKTAVGRNSRDVSPLHLQASENLVHTKYDVPQFHTQMTTDRWSQNDIIGSQSWNRYSKDLDISVARSTSDRLPDLPPDDLWIKEMKEPTHDLSKWFDDVPGLSERVPSGRPPRAIGSNRGKELHGRSDLYTWADAGSSAETLNPPTVNAQV